MSPNNPWFSLLAGILLAASSILSLPKDGGKFEGFPVPAFGGWLLLVLGVALVFLSARALLRGGGKEKSPTDEDIRKAKEALERIHLREHGTLPDYPDEAEKHFSDDMNGKGKA